ncbi:MXAN_6640 family putative metalloprotease [Roseisolibacter agri]|uniref:Lipoprotein n=1 Tax=Roseisolibacter agri TaxID=2014610 RepID=A0AA37V5G9_9BACT|nr:MXAN_6640 family putative metalloprotease [Roseisolibacter agri]GLC24116.1 hypothetical protein rosag_06290 [Roseisolibacter agri]
MASVRPLAAVLAALVVGACADDASAPLAPAVPAAPRLAVSPGQTQQELKSALDLIEDDYDAGALDKENVNRYREYAVSSPDKLPSKYRSSARGKDATLSMVQMARDWSTLSAATRKEIRDLRANGFGNLKQTKETAHYVLHYTTQGDWAVPARDADRNGTPDFIDAAAASWEQIWQREVVQLGYDAPKLTTDAAGNPTNKFHVYYKDMPYYGYCMPENVELTTTSPVPLGTASAWIAVENDFVGFPPNDEDVTGTEVVRTGALKVTQAHEFMHALQFNINVYQSGWLFESHATWAEDAVYDGINDWHWYINRFLRTPDLPVTSRFVYGSAFFLNWVSERAGVDAPRQIWLAARANTATEAVRLAGLGGSWASIAAFAPAQATLAIDDFSGGATSVIPNPNTTLLRRATHDAYPVSVQVPAATKQAANGAPWGLGSNFVDFVPTATSETLTLTVDGADGHAWRAYAILTSKSGTTSVEPITLNASSAGTLTVRGFGRSVAKVTLAVTIAAREGVQVPFSYGATLGGTLAN